jgi:hypothetical protein
MDPITAGTKSAISTLKGAQTLGNDLGKIVGDQQANIEATVNEQHRKRLEAKAREDALRKAAEFKAFEEYEKEKSYQKEVQLLKARAIAKYGQNAWNEIENIKNKLEKDRTEEEKLMDNDREKINQVFWWCMTIATIITFFLKLYK